jgi:UDP-N-acetyl-D-mannosaminuronate dehydrogenase
MNHKNLLLQKKANIGVWGTGYIGYSTLMYFANAGVLSVGYDPNEVRTQQIREGTCPVPGLDNWLEIDPVPLLEASLLSVYSDPREILNSRTIVHFVAVPTESLAGNP